MHMYKEVYIHTYFVWRLIKKYKLQILTFSWIRVPRDHLRDGTVIIHIHEGDKYNTQKPNA